LHDLDVGESAPAIFTEGVESEAGGIVDSLAEWERESADVQLLLGVQIELVVVAYLIEAWRQGWDLGGKTAFDAAAEIPHVAVGAATPAIAASEERGDADYEQYDDNEEGDRAADNDRSGIALGPTA
jgi:hypothetical protein